MNEGDQGRQLPDSKGAGGRWPRPPQQAPGMPQDSDRRFQELVHELPEPVVEIDAHGNATFANRSALESFGYTQRDLEQQSINVANVIAPQDRQRALGDLERALRGESVPAQEYRLRRKDGSEFPGLVHSRSIMRNGRIVGMRAIIVDISKRRRAEDALHQAKKELEGRVRERTAALAQANDLLQRELAERRRAEEALSASESRYRAIFDAANDAIFVHEVPSGRIVDVNIRMTEMYGYTPDETRHLTIGELSADTPPYTQTDALRWMDKAITEGPQLFAWLAKRKDGSVFWVEVNLKRANIGGVTRLLSLVRDITERKLAEQERERLLAETKELAQVAQQRAAELQAVLDNMLDAVFVTDEQGRIVMVNSAALRLVGLDRDQMLRPYAEIMQVLRARKLDGTPLRPEEQPLCQGVSREDTSSWDEIIYNPSRQQDVFVRINAAPIRDQNGRTIGGVAVGRDISEIVETDRLKNEFIRVAAHELKTPVTIMKGYAQALLHAEPDAPPARRRILESIDRGADRIAGIVGDLLDISRLRMGTPEMTYEQVDLSELVREAAAHAALQSPRHRLRVVAPKPATVRGDRERLRTDVLDALLDNAITYSPKGGNVDVTVTVQDREALVSVRDEGIGIPLGRREHIFEPFYRAHAGTPYDYGGMGVGLYIAREIIRHHGGKMWFESREGVGSTFYFSLPLSETGNSKRPGQRETSD